VTESSLRRHTAIFGLVATVISLTDVPLYFIYTGAPPQWDILTRVLVGIVSSTILIVFLVGFRLVICQGRPQLEWAATIVLVSGLMWLTFSMVAQRTAGWVPRRLWRVGLFSPSSIASPRVASAPLASTQPQLGNKLSRKV
jgi:hypothetical protein